jgi:hypothetical protein
VIRARPISSVRIARLRNDVERAEPVRSRSDAVQVSVAFQIRFRARGKILRFRKFYRVAMQLSRAVCFDRIPLMPRVHVFQREIDSAPCS